MEIYCGIINHGYRHIKTVTIKTSDLRLAVVAILSMLKHLQILIYMFYETIKQI